MEYFCISAGVMLVFDHVEFFLLSRFAFCSCVDLFFTELQILVEELSIPFEFTSIHCW